MDLATEPEYYTANIDNDGSYVDKIPSFHLLQNGIRCSCGSRKDKVFNNYASFSGHIKTLCHRKWLETLNQNKHNYYKENEDMKVTIVNQRLIIARLEKEIISRNNTIEQLTQHNLLLKEKYEYREKNNTTCNLLDF